MYFFRNSAYYKDGLNGLAEASNAYLREFVNNSDNKDLVNKVNAIIMNFPDTDTIEAIINYNIYLLWSFLFPFKKHSFYI